MKPRRWFVVLLAGLGAACGRSGPPAVAPSTLAPALLATFEDSPLTLELSGYDDHDATEDLLVEIVRAPEHGTISEVAGLAPFRPIYRPSENFNGSDWLEFVVIDLDGLESTRTRVLLAVGAVNDAPVAADDVATTDSVTSVAIDVLANDTDVDGEPPLLVSLGEPTAGTVEFGPEQEVVYTPTHPVVGLQSFEYTIRDAAGDEDTGLVVVDIELGVPVEIVSFVADPPVIPAGGSSTLRWQSNEVAERCTFDPLLPTEATSGSVQVTPSETTRYELTCEGPGGPDNATVEVAVTTPPVALVPAATATAEDVPLSMVLTGVDDRDPENTLLVTVTRLPLGGFGPVTGTAPLTVVYTPPTHFNGTDTVGFRVTDSIGLASEERVFTVSVAPRNDPPQANPDLAQTDSVTPVTIDVLANDVDIDGDALALVSVTQPAAGTTEIISATAVRFVPAHPTTGQVTFGYTMRDAAGVQAVGTVTVGVSLGQPVLINSFAATPTVVRIGTTTTLAWSTTEADSCTLTPTGAQVAVSGTAVRTINSDTTFTLECQGPAGPVRSQVTARASRPPSAVGPGLLELDEDGSIQFVLTGIDDFTVESGLGVTVSALPANGTVAPTSGAAPLLVRYTPAANFNGVDSLQFRVTDSQGAASATETVVFSVRPVAGGRAAAGRILHVDPGGAGGSGLTWDDAFTTLDAAVAAARPDDEVWVAAGEYWADAGEPVLRLPAGVSVYGGFAGGETAVWERPAGARSVLRGREAAVVDASGAVGALLDGFELRDGRALDGAGLSAADAEGLYLSNLVVAENEAAADGGGVWTDGSVALVDVTFTGNRAARGGALHAGDAFVLNSSFANNEAAEGAAIHAAGGVVLVRYSSFLDNTGDGGVLTGTAGGSLDVEGCAFWGGSGPSGSVAVAHSCGSAWLSELGAGNGVAATNPLVELEGLLFLAGDATACLDSGSVDAADDPLFGYPAAGLDWRWLTTSADGGPDADDDGDGVVEVDCGRHYLP